LDALVVEHVVDRLSRPDAVELTQPAPRDDLDEVRERGRALRARLDSLSVEFADGILSTAQIKTMTKRINEQLAEIDAVLRDSQTTRVYDGVIGAGDVDAAFDGLDLDRKRAIIDDLLEITVRPSGRCGRVFKREDVDVLYRSSKN
jgi:site-specific DNA recombinase